MHVSGEQSHMPPAALIPSPPLSSPSASLEAFGPSPSQEPTLPELPLFDASVFSPEKPFDEVPSPFFQVLDNVC